MFPAPKLRLTVLVYPREQASLSGPVLHGNQNQSQPVKPRQLLLVIKDPEKVSLGDLANQIKDQWRELWPSEEPLQIKRLLDNAYPDAVFSVHCSVADIWVDNGRCEREGFDQRGTVRVIQIPVSSTPSLSHRYQREGSVFQDVEGAAREAKRKFLDAAISANDSLVGARETTIRTPSREEEQPDPRERQSKRLRPSERTDPSSPSPAGIPRETVSSPLFYHNRRVPSFAQPHGHRGHLPNHSNSSPKKGLGLGITASPLRATTSNSQVIADGMPGPSSMPPPPRPRYSLRPPTYSSPLESSSQNNSPLGNMKQAESNASSAPWGATRYSGPRTRASLKTPGSGQRSHHPRSLSVSTGALIAHITPDYVERDRRELEEARMLLRSSGTNPECFPLLDEICHLHEEKLEIKANSYTDAHERVRLLGMNRRKLGRRREKLEKLKGSGELYKESDADTNTGEGPTNEGVHRDRDESSEEESLKGRTKRRRIERWDLSAESGIAQRISSLRAHTQRRKDRLSDVQGVQVVIKDLASNTTSLNKSPGASDSQLNGARSGDAEPEERPALDENQDDDDDDSPTDSDGGDVEFEDEGLEASQNSPFRNHTASQGASPRRTPTLGDGPAEETNGANGVDSDPKNKSLEPRETMLRVSSVEEVPRRQRSVFPTLQMLLRQKKVLAKLSSSPKNRPRNEEPCESSDDETSEDDSPGVVVGDRV